MTVRVKRGETLKMIAQRNDCTVQELMRWNRLSKPTVHRGQRLKIRVGDEDAIAAARDSVEIAKLAHVRVTPRHHRSRSASASASHYAITVKSGDTLAAIARRTGVTVAQLKRANKLNGSQVRSGQRLRVPRGSAG